ncbi:MAG: hypothetical protein DRI34_05180 [Deltaproteobacteria bacterium]|nr:MAG: hypothetical protein DRI34_05180 [Deltaproteobacteria bacterium]
MKGRNDRKSGPGQPRPSEQRAARHQAASGQESLPPDILELLDDIDEDEKTRQLDMSQPPGAESIDPVDLSLPASSDEEQLPFFVPAKPPAAGSRRKPGVAAEPPPAAKGPARGPDLATLFDGVDLDEEVSVEMAVHEIFSNGQPAASTPPPSPQPSPTPASGAGSDPGSEPPGTSRFARGFTQGRRPLDVREFGTSTERNGGKRRTPDILLTGHRGPVPMAMPHKVRRRRFVFTITFRDIILLLLVVVLAAGIYTGWRLYQDYIRRQEVEQLERKRALIERGKSKTIEKQRKKHRRTRDIP